MIIEVGIENFEKYNPRTDRRTASWFRFENDFLTDPVIQNLSPVQTLIYIHCLGNVSKKKGGFVKINSKLSSLICKTTEEEFVSGLNYLKDLKLVTFGDGSTPENVVMVSNGSPTYERTNVTNITDVRNETARELALSVLDFWNSKKIIIHEKEKRLLGKVEKALKRKRRYGVEQVRQAIENYHKILTEPEFIWTHKWSLWEFLEKNNADKFFPDEFNLEMFPRTSTKNAVRALNRSAIDRAIRSGVTSISNLEPELREALKKDELDFIEKNGGLLHLGKGITESQLNQIFERGAR